MLTFLRRGSRHELGAVDVEEPIEALQAPIVADGRTIAAEALDIATRGSRGYPN